MGIIKILDESVSNIIAAGEVVENPSSLIKELLENSLDAGSKSVLIEVKDGGRHINISDDGKGMGKDDLLLCVERHATSKINKKEDLFDLTTYGFRGEALSSICAVAKVKIVSKTVDDKIGNAITILGGKVTSIKEAEYEKNSGTSIEIRELFFNTPARLKFLRKATTEYLNIKDIIIQEALANPWVQITLVIEGKESIKTTGNGIENCIVEIFGRNVLKNLIEFEYGYVGNSSIFRANRDSMFVFVNGRPVKSKIIENAIIDSYYTKLTKGKYPFGIVFFELEPKDIDVNVHPSKKIVKFSNDIYVYDIIKNSIADKVSGGDELTTIEVKFSSDNESVQNYESKKEYYEPQPKEIETEVKENKKTFLNIPREQTFIREIQSKMLTEPTYEEPPKEIFEKKEEPTKNLVSHMEDYSKETFRVIGQFNKSFILVEKGEVLEIYDQHIIHERIIYEQLKKDYLSKQIQSQGLLIPQRFIVDPRDREIILEKKEILKEFGFEIEDLEKHEMLIRSIPAFDFDGSADSLLQEIIKELKEYRQNDPRESIIISMSCKGAVKANKKLSYDEMTTLIDKLHKIGEYTCPHGRPIILKLSLDEIEKKFKRK